MFCLAASESSGGGLEFVGWENTAGFIGGALVTDTLINSSVVTVDNLLAVSVPGPLAGAGLPAFYWLAAV